jgi:hypothetical protein
MRKNSNPTGVTVVGQPIVVSCKIFISQIIRNRLGGNPFNLMKRKCYFYFSFIAGKERQTVIIKQINEWQRFTIAAKDKQFFYAVQW